jgi:hypothetical protein
MRHENPEAEVVVCMISRTGKKDPTPSVSPENKSLGNTHESKTKKRGAATIEKRTRALDEIRSGKTDRNKNINETVQHSLGAFKTIRENASRRHDVAAQAEILQHKGLLGEISSDEFKSLLHPAPPSLHLRAASGPTAHSIIDCVVSLGEPEPTGETRRILLSALQLMQRGNFGYELIPGGDEAASHRISLPAGIIESGPSGLPTPHENVTCDLTIQKSEARRVIIRQPGVILVDLQFASAHDADEAMLASLHKSDARTEQTFKIYKRLVNHWCEWAQAQRDAGAFRPLLKDLLMRSGSSKIDPDIHDFNEFYWNTRDYAKTSRNQGEVFAVFDAFRLNTGNPAKSPLPPRSRLLQLFSQKNIGRDAESHARLFEILENVEQWLSRNKPELTLQELALSRASMAAHDQTLTRMSRNSRIGPKSGLMDSLLVLSVFLESADLESRS